MKGILAFRDEPRRYAVQGVHMIVEGDHQRGWKDDDISKLLYGNWMRAFQELL